MTQHSSYWLDKDMFEDDDVIIDDRPDLTRITKLAAVRRAISNFVTILTSRNDITVQYSSGTQSYATKNEIVLSATDNPDKFDYQVGLALHEASHILLTDFEYLQHWGAVLSSQLSYGNSWNGLLLDKDNRLQSDLAQCVFHPSLVSLLPTMPVGTFPSSEQETTYVQTVRAIFGYIKLLMNILEDRRIDKWVFERAGGYRPYYTALYGEDTLTNEIGKNLKYNPEWREPTLDNYINRVLLSIHPDASPDALPGLDILYKMVDVSTIDRLAPDAACNWMTPSYDAQPRLYREASELLVTMLRFAALHVAQQGGAAPSQKIQFGPPRMAELPNLDIGNILRNTEPVDGEDDIDFAQRPAEPGPLTRSGTPKAIKFNEKKATRDVQKFLQQTEGAVAKKKIKKNEKDAIESLDAAQAEMVQLGGKLKGGVAMVTRKITKGLLLQPWFVFGGGWASAHGNALAAGRRMGQILQRRLEVRNDPVFTKTTRLPHGNIDRRLLSQLGMDITSVFSKTQVDRYKPAMLHLSIDGSGSMGGRKWQEVMTVATALAYVASKSSTIDVVISLRGGSDIPLVSIVFDSRVDKFPHWMHYAPYLHPGGATPEGLCYEATMKLMLENATTHQVYLVNFSDGQPSFTLNLRGLGPAKRRNVWSGSGGLESVYYYGDTAFRHTREQMMQLRSAGVQILSYFIGNSSAYKTDINTFRQMYGESAEFVDVTNATMVLKTLNKLLLQRGS